MLRYINIIRYALCILLILLMGCFDETSQLQDIPEYEQDIPEYEFEGLWRLEGYVGGLAIGDLNGDGQDEIIVPDYKKICTYDTSGNELDTIYVTNNQPQIRVSDLDGDGRLEIIGFGSWGGKITALENNGDLFWEFAADSGVDDVAVYNIDGDSTQEVIVGFNGSTGLYVLDYTGEVRWEYTEIGNVWHVSGGDLNSDGSIEVVSTAADGNIHIFNAEGTLLEELDSGIYTHFVYIGEFIADSIGPELITSGSEGDNGIIQVFDGSGDFIWEEAILDRVHSIQCLAQDGLLAIGTVEGQVYIYNAEGELVFNAQGLGLYVLVTWIKDENGNYILIAGSSDGLFAY